MPHHRWVASEGACVPGSFRRIQSSDLCAAHTQLLIGSRKLKGKRVPRRENSSPQISSAVLLELSKY